MGKGPLLTPSRLTASVEGTNGCLYVCPRSGGLGGMLLIRVAPRPTVIKVPRESHVLVPTLKNGGKVALTKAH